jgi:hypothetical protein
MNSQELRALQEAYQQVCETSANVGPVEMERDPGYKMTYGERQKALKDKAEKIRSTKNEEFVDEAMSSYDKNRKRAAQRAAARNDARKQGKTGSVPGVGYVSPRPERETYRDSAGVERHTSGARMPQKESFDLYDAILSHLLDEGYADTNEAAIAIMANMSEEWRESIVEKHATFGYNADDPGDDFEQFVDKGPKTNKQKRNAIQLNNKILSKPGMPVKGV